MKEKLAQLAKALKPLKKYKYMKNKKLNKEISRLAAISTYIDETANERKRKMFSMQTGKSLNSFACDLESIAEGYKNSNGLVKAVKKLEKYLSKNEYNGSLLNQVILSEYLWEVKKELGFAEGNFFKNYQKDVVEPIQYLATLEEKKRPKIKDFDSIPYNLNKESRIKSRRVLFISLLKYLGAFLAVLLMAACVGWVAFLAITWFYLTDDPITIPLIITGGFTLYMMFNGLFSGIAEIIEEHISFLETSFYSYRAQKRNYRKIKRSMFKVSEENIDAEMLDDAMNLYNIVDDILENGVEITINYSRYELAKAAFSRMKKLLREDYFSSAEEFKEAFIVYVENEIEYNNWRAEYDRKQRAIEAERERIEEARREKERKQRELESKIKDAIKTIKETNETYQKIYDKVDEINENLNDIERDIRYR
jgi:hypothetical protein